MNVIYRFLINGVECRPIYGADLVLDIEQETSQRFYRKKLSGKLVFLRSDFDLINNAAFDTVFVLILQISEDYGQSWNTLNVSEFMKTDCTFDEDNRKVEVETQQADQYTDVIAGMENEYNLVKLAPAIQPLHLKKRPLIQIYVPGDSVVSCFLSGMDWEQDANATTNHQDLVEKYYFSQIVTFIELTMSGDAAAVNGVYSGKLGIDNKYYNKSGYYVQCQWEEVIGETGVYIVYNFILYNSSTGVALYDTEPAVAEVGTEFYNPVGTLNFRPLSSSIGNPESYGTSAAIYARYLCDVDSIEGTNTYPIPDDDIVQDNRNYQRVIGYNFDVVFQSQNYSTEPTEWGLYEPGRYYAPPGSIFGQTFFPISRTSWRANSYWFAFYLMDWILEEKARKDYVLRDTFELSSCISVLLAEFAPEVTHQATSEYSEFLYSGNNPISGNNFKLLMSVKTNIINGEYQTPAQAAPITLQTITNMLRDVFNCYWHIDELNRFRIEHVQWYRNGGRYQGGTLLSVDYTASENVRNGKKWAFSTSNYTFDKLEMAERFQYGWMDDVTEVFKGIPIEVVSKYVTKGKLEEKIVANFTSDIDLMILNPGNISPDGFCLFAAVASDVLNIDRTYLPYVLQSGIGELVNPLINIQQGNEGKDGELIVTVLEDAGSPCIYFYDSLGEVITSKLFSKQGVKQRVGITIPAGAVSIAVGGILKFEVETEVYGLEIIGEYELPFIKRSLNGIDYILQNGYLAFSDLQEKYLLYDMPARNVIVNNYNRTILSVSRNKKQTIIAPMPIDVNPINLVRTYLGDGQVEKISLNLSSLTSKSDLKYDTE